MINVCNKSSSIPQLALDFPGYKPNLNYDRKEMKIDLRGELLVAILKSKSDFAILQDQGWYRIPVDHAPARWPPQALAFYQPKEFKDDAYRVRYFGDIDEIDVVERRGLFPNEIESSLSQKKYFRIRLKSLKERNPPILSSRPRRLVFIPSTWQKFILADGINDLFDDSPLEDCLWDRFKRLNFLAERQWGVRLKKHFYQLDFALFCNQGQIDIEADGDHWHSEKSRIPSDNERDNDLNSQGWHVLRFNGKQIRGELESYCLGKIAETVNNLGGLGEANMVPRIFYPAADGTTQQLTLFDGDDAEYT